MCKYLCYLKRGQIGDDVRHIATRTLKFSYFIFASSLAAVISSIQSSEGVKSKEDKGCDNFALYTISKLLVYYWYTIGMLLVYY